MDSSKKVIVVRDFEPAKYRMNSIQQCIKDNKFEINDTEKYGSYNINFGDGFKSSSLPVSHTYSQAGKFDLTSIKLWNKGCSDTQTYNIIVNKNPVANFSVPLLCTSKQITITNNSLLGDAPIFSSWYTSDSGLYAGTNLIRSFEKAEKYPIILAVRDSLGCSDSLKKIVYVGPTLKPTFYFNGSDYNQEKGYSYYFVANADTFNQYTWQLGSASASNIKNPIVWFNQSDQNEHIILTVKTNYGCYGTADSTILIKGLTLYLFPNSFTPNSDGHNDGFGIAGPEYIKQYKLRIFNRWGRRGVLYSKSIRIVETTKPIARFICLQSFGARHLQPMERSGWGGLFVAVGKAANHYFRIRYWQLRL